MGVVGAGIGGLSAALSLLRSGFDVHVFEQASALGEVGAGVQISPNALRILHGLGLALAVVAPTAAVTSAVSTIRLRRIAAARRDVPLDARGLVIFACGYAGHSGVAAKMVSDLLAAADQANATVVAETVGEHRIRLFQSLGVCVRTELLPTRLLSTRPCRQRRPRRVVMTRQSRRPDRLYRVTPMPPAVPNPRGPAHGGRSPSNARPAGDGGPLLVVAACPVPMAASRSVASTRVAPPSECPVTATPVPVSSIGVHTSGGHTLALPMHQW
jgi:hypothetical protein